MSTNLFIIRHGEAVCNVERTVGGMRGCQGLTPRGHEQVRRLAERLSRGEIKADALYASTIRRARETAEPVAEALGLPIKWDDELHEWRPGDEADTLSDDEATERFGRLSLTTPYAAGWPGSESIAQFFTRAGTALDSITRRHEGQTVVVVAHGGVIEASFYLMLGLSPFTAARAGFWVTHTSITHWRYPSESLYLNHPRWYLMRFNDDVHLSGMKAREE